ncbi:hypothetical protein L207DRAFT_519970 [Hyaloscypha variabilis F]|uniref:N-acetyltransferase domain-containing protein n=1 Tax=Hyaloscypha variabilis (strain UAMH 11265 / GT02V1 / F) TaxID=1149755 RepID=A0A2J6QX81_HYAVF|nr:hypothetical protein L207DRAFT_519970 [Hyaloscypha variabilis F]
MATPSPSASDFLLLPLSFPNDAPNIAHLHYQTMLSTLPPSTPAPPEESFNTATLPLIFSRFSHPNPIAYKLVPSPPTSPEKIIGYIYFTPPSSPDTRTIEERQKELRGEVAKSTSPTDKELLFHLKWENAELKEKYFGPGYKERFWELESLVVDGGFQRRGLGSWLVREGMKEVERRVGEDEGKEGRKVEGVVLVANPAGRRTYERAGFEYLGGRPVRTVEMRDDHMHLWFWKRFG